MEQPQQGPLVEAVPISLMLEVAATLQQPLGEEAAQLKHRPLVLLEEDVQRLLLLMVELGVAMYHLALQVELEEGNPLLPTEEQEEQAI